MKLQQFNGGLNTRLHPSYIQQNEAVVYTNIDSSKGTLKAFNLPLLTGIALKQDHVYFDAKQEWVEFDQRTYTAEFQGVLYSCNGSTRPQKYDGVNTYNLGIDAPTVKLTGTPTLAPKPIDSIDAKPIVTIVPGAIKGTEAYYYLAKRRNITGVYAGAMFLKVKSDGTTEILGTAVTDERQPSVVDDSAGLMSVTFTAAKTIEADETLEIYRFYNGVYRRITVFTSATDSFNDNVDDISAGQALDFTKFATIFNKVQYVYTYYNSATGAESAPSPVSDEIDCTQYGATEILLASIQAATDPQVDTIRYYRIGDQLTNYSLATTSPPAPASWFDFDNIDGRILTTQGFDVPADGLKFITEAYAMLFGAVGSRLYFTPIGKPDAWPTLFFINFSHEITGIAPTASGLIVMSKYSSDLILGTGPTSLTKVPLAGDQGCLAHESIQRFGNSALWVSSDGICVSSGGPVEVISKLALGKQNLLPVDSAMHDQVYYAVDETSRILVADLRFGLVFRELNFDIDRLVIANDVLYGWKDGFLYELFASQDSSQFEYKSPLFIEGRATQNKYYKNVYFYVDGDIIINVYIDENLVITKRFAGKDNFQLKVPAIKGYNIQFEITGRGEVREIYYELGAGDV